MLVAMRNGQADCVPAAPDMSNMIPCRLTGKPFWDIYLYHDPPLWMAYIEAVRHFGHDGWLAGLPCQLDCDLKEAEGKPAWQEAIVARTPDRLYTRLHARVDGKETWSDWCNAYYIDNPSTHGIPLAKAGLPDGPPERWEDVARRTRFKGMEPFHTARKLMGERGVVLPSVGLPGLAFSPEGVYEYYDNPSKVIERCEQQRERTVRRTRELVTHKPDAILIGMSGHMIWNPEPIFRKLSLPAL
jgi:hypothetical protein